METVLGAFRAEAGALAAAMGGVGAAGWVPLTAAEAARVEGLGLWWLTLG